MSCGPTCLRQVYRFYGEDRAHDDTLLGLERNGDGGTLAVYLGLAALRHGYRAALYPLGLRIFDPTWRDLSDAALADKLRQRAALSSAERRDEIGSWLKFLDLGGAVFLEELSPALLVRLLDRGHPVVCGLSATWLYRQPRERPEDNEEDDVGGESVGHFVVVCGYTGGGLHFHVRDPSEDVPFSPAGEYRVGAQRLCNAILLGDATRDAMLLEIWPRPGGAGELVRVT